MIHIPLSSVVIFQMEKNFLLAILGLLMMLTFIFLIVTKRCSALLALITIPIIFGLFAGFGLELKTMIIQGIEKVAPTGVMLMFAILYFAVMIEAGLFDPIIRLIIRFAKQDPQKIVIGTAFLAIISALDGDGTTTYVITASALFPLYQRLKLNPLVLSCIAMLAFGVMNMTPWGGPLSRAVIALDVSMNDVFIPLIPIICFGLLWTIFVAFILGRQERIRLRKIYGEEWLNEISRSEIITSPKQKKSINRKLVFNFILTSVLMFALVTSVLPLCVLFIIAFAIALLINIPQLQHQKEFFSKNASNVMAVVILVFASGVFTGILTGTKMIDAMANSLVTLVPKDLGPHFATITAFSSMIFTYFMANDPYYLGILPIIAKTASAYGVTPVEIARASVLGMPMHAMSPLVGASYLLMGLIEVDFSDNQKFIFKWALGSSFVMIFSSLLLGIISN